MFRDPEIRANIQDYLDELIELYEITDPAKGLESEEAKLALARHAVEIWWRMHDKLMLWAQSHLTGYVFCMSDPDLVQHLEILTGGELDEDSHELEYLGLQFALNPVDSDDPKLNEIWQAIQPYPGIDTSGLLLDIVDPAVTRSLIEELLTSRTANSSFWRFELQTALRALNEGEVKSLVKPSGGRKQGQPFSLKQWKLEALRQVYFRLGKGLKKYRAIQDVADGIGQSPETLRDWEKQLLKSEDYGNDLYCCQLAGEFESELKSGHYTSIPDYEDYGSHRGTENIVSAAYFFEIIEKRTFEEIKENIRRYRKGQKSGA